MAKNEKSLPWDEVERAIYKEIEWLENNIDTFLKEEVGVPVSCKKCLIREIAILILSGKIKAADISRKNDRVNFWDHLSAKIKRKKVYHGGEWHRNTMQKIENHFLEQGFDVVREPNLYWGRADLGVFKKGTKDLYIEVGTTAFFKLCVNLKEMNDCIYLIVPNDEKLIEFRCLKHKRFRRPLSHK